MNDGRQMVGQMLAFDKVCYDGLYSYHPRLTGLQHMNLVLADTEEFRRVKRKATKAAAAPGAGGSSAPLVESEEKRTLGLTIVRGAHIISLSVESPPPADASARLGASAPGGVAAALAPGAGIARPAGRGAPVGLAVRGPMKPHLCDNNADVSLGPRCWNWCSTTWVRGRLPWRSAVR
jgi:small nuclear ribonucleoprotein B and B'